MDLASLLRIQAHANHLANRRLLGAIQTLPDGEFSAPRTGFFPSLAETLNHILAVDEYYIGALYGDAGLAAHYDAFTPARSVAELLPRQTRSDDRLIAWCERLDARGCDSVIDMDRGTHVQREQACHVLAHLFMHQTHHRGQVHAMLSGTPVKPPQLDEFLMPSDAKFRVDDMAALGWIEAAVYGSHEGRS
jgi:uncharacterized damage-inducible protein DinB